MNTALSRRSLIYFIGFFLFVTIVLRPWRAGVAQDDGAYAALAFSLSHGNWIQHPILLAAAWPQAVLGAAEIFLFPNIGIAGLNCLTWLVFFGIGLFLILGTELPLTIALGVLSFPVMLQYASSYLSEVYAIFFLICALALTKRLRAPRSRSQTLGLCFLLVISVVALCLQRQTLIALPFGWALAQFFYQRRQRRSLETSTLWLFLSCTVALAIYSTFPKSILQSSYMNWKLQQLQFIPASVLAAQFFLPMIELLVGTGIFLIPLLRWDFLSRAQIAGTFVLQIFFTFILYKSGLVPLSAGVLFTSYFPNWFSAFFLSFGLWGLLTLVQMSTTLNERDRALFFGSLIALLPITLFYSVMSAGDIKYSLPLSFPFIFLGSRLWQTSGAVAPLRAWCLTYFGAVLIVSLFVNTYNLDTMDARWKIAQDLQRAGTPITEISAGYGRDLFEMGWPCAQKAIDKTMRASKPQEQKQLLSDHLFAKIPRVYEDEWISRYIIKPAAIMGHPLALNQNIRPGQDSTPVQIITYRSLGLKNQLAVFQVSNSHPAWCDQ